MTDRSISSESATMTRLRVFETLELLRARYTRQKFAPHAHDEYVFGMVEAGAQMACYLYNIRRPEPKVIAFLRIEDCAFRSMVTPGDDLHILANEIKIGRRRFISDVQGVVGKDRIAFDARVTGMQLDE